MTTQRIETWLGQHDGVTDAVHVPRLPLAEIDMVASITNQSRFEPIDQPTVDRYVAALEDGAFFPSIIVRQVKATKTTQLVVLGGNHRARAHLDAGRTTIDAWLVTCDDLTALELAYGDNATHGLAPTENERIAHALVLVDRGRTASEAARTVGIDAQRVHRRLATQGVEKRAAGCGVTAELAQVRDTVRPRLASLRDDRLFTKVVRTLAAETIGVQDAVRIIGDINAQPNLKAALDVLELNVTEHRASTGAVGRTVGRPSANPRLMLLTALGTIRNLNAADVVDACRTNADLETLRQACIAGGRHLMAIDKLARTERSAPDTGAA